MDTILGVYVRKSRNFYQVNQFEEEASCILKVQIERNLFAFLAKSAVQELKKMSDERLRKLRRTLF